MLVNGKTYQTIWMEGQSVCMIDQNLLPFEFIIRTCKTFSETCEAICDMTVRGAGAIGAAAGFATAQAFMESVGQNNPAQFVRNAKAEIESTRPTARNLFYAVEKVYEAGLTSIENALKQAHEIAAKDSNDSRKIGEWGATLFGEETNVLTHCNAGWLAFVDYGTALAPVYLAHLSGKKVFVYADETRPRNQGARLTAWELLNADIPHLIIPDNAAASLMAQKEIDLIIVGADRIAANGDVANKIGTLEKAVCAREFGIPFYVAAPTSTFDLQCQKGEEIPIETRSPDEVLFQTGMDEKGNKVKILVCNPGSSAYNQAFDVTPSNYITGIITEKGIIKPSREEIFKILTN